MAEFKYKDAAGRVYQIDDGYVYLLPGGCVVISDAEAAVLLLPLPKTIAEIAAENTAAARRELAVLDLASIRDLRSYIAAKPDAPQSMKDREALAVLARARL